MKKFMKIALVTAMMLFLIISGYLILSTSASLPLPSHTSDTFRLTVANINFENVQEDDISKTFLKTDSDLFVLFEWTGKNLNLEMLEIRGFTIRLNKPRRGTHGLCIITKHLEIRDAVLLPVDYVWIPKEFTTLNAYMISLPGSDHRGVVIDSQWEKS